MTKIIMKKVAGILLMVGIICKCLGQGVVITNEYWIEPNTNGLNQGTLANPYFGNNQATFDKIFSNLVTRGYVVVHLVAGTYQTAGLLSYVIGPYTTVSGSAMDSTIVRFALTNKSYQGVLVGGYTASHVTIENLTVDANGQSNNFADGVDLTGDFGTIRRVKVINPIGNGTAESFPLALAVC